MEEPNDAFPRQVVIKRTPASRTVARLQIVAPRAGELYYLRALLLHRSAYSFEELKMVNGVHHRTFQEAAITIGLFEDRSEAM